MDWLWAIPGAALVLLVMHDVHTTTISTRGAGPLTRLATWAMWNAALCVHRRLPWHGLLSRVGGWMLFVSVAQWIVLLSVGYFLLMSSDPAHIVASQSRAPADALERAYYTGFTLFTLGVGDFVPTSTWQRALSVLGTLNGLALVTLAITYLVPVISAVTEKRQLAARIYGLGDGDAATTIVRAWDGNSAQHLGEHLRAIVPSLLMHAERHLTYPVLHHFHAQQRRESFPCQAVVLGDVLLLLTCGLQEAARPTASDLHATISALDAYLRVIGESHVERAGDPPALPSLQPLREAGLAVVADEVYVQDAAAWQDRRRHLAAVLRQQGWMLEEE